MKWTELKASSMWLPSEVVCGHSWGTLDSDSFSSHVRGIEGGSGNWRGSKDAQSQTDEEDHWGIRWRLLLVWEPILSVLSAEPQVEIFPQRELRNLFYRSPALRCFSATLMCRLTKQISKGLSSAVKFPLGRFLKPLLVLGTEKRWQLHAFKFPS